MIHPANIVHNIVKKDEFATDHPEVKKVMKLDGRLCCGRCESPLGYFTSKGSTSFMLSKYQISTSAQSETPDNLFWNQTLENLCASELYYRCRSQSCARFFFIPHGSLRPLLLVSFICPLKSCTFILCSLAVSGNQHLIACFFTMCGVLLCVSLS
eukprot:TRINITY_DN2425_c0_g1_i9.p1 TRINITY_DN2425_c0_g1~~TRINITY_DN2425_c0_g1_i9.p1  ORF type:complete len:155 (-),score=7.19 TRINITY_DN2425_c0_g1_i9:500-964(-)